MDCGMVLGGGMRVLLASLFVGSWATSGWAQQRSSARSPATQSISTKGNRTSRPAAPSYELSVESVPDWAMDDERPAAGVDQATQKRTPSGRATRSPIGGSQHEAGYRGRRVASGTVAVEPEMVQVPFESISEGVPSDLADPIYSGGAPVAANDGLARQVLEPVEVIDGSATACSAGASACPADHDGGICDVVYRSYGCPRDPCPCPTDEVLSYYRCEHYGYFPTFWRPWPCGWLKYRPDVQDTVYDRFRKTAPVEGNGGGIEPGLGPGPRSSSDEDLDRELQEMLRTAPTPGRVPAPPGRQRRPPELLPEDSLPEPPRSPDAPRAPPPKIDPQSSLTPRSRARFAQDTRPGRDDEVETAAYRPYPTAIPRAGNPAARYPAGRVENRSAAPARSGGIKISRRRPGRNDL